MTTKKLSSEEKENTQTKRLDVLHTSKKPMFRGSKLRTIRALLSYQVSQMSYVMDVRRKMFSQSIPSKKREKVKISKITFLTGLMNQKI